jgi:uncharacterized iron-regulated protein
MLANVAKADVVFVGEQHDDSNTHYLELAVLEGLARRRTGAVLVGLEMFERDVQEPLDHFQMGHMDEQEFLKASRPWPNYVHDYKPLVDFAVKKDWPIFASNVPRPLATDVSKTGLGALKGKSTAEAKWFAEDLRCPLDEYYHRFADAMGAHPDKGKAASGVAPADLERYYQAQCLKDETMAESVARAYDIAAGGGKRPLVVHFNGAFHSDFTEGAAERAKRRLPGKRVIVMTMLPVGDLDAVSPDRAERKRADYLVYTIKEDKDKDKK